MPARKKPRHVTRTVSALTARTQFGQIMELALASLQADSRKRRLDLLSMDEIDAEIAAARKERKRRRA